jgi:hypothetical protein
MAEVVIGVAATWQQAAIVIGVAATWQQAAIVIGVAATWQQAAIVIGVAATWQQAAMSLSHAPPHLHETDAPARCLTLSEASYWSHAPAPPRHAG